MATRPPPGLFLLVGPPGPAPLPAAPFRSRAPAPDLPGSSSGVLAAPCWEFLFGKSHLATGLGIEAVRRGYKVHFTGMEELVGLLKTQEITRSS
ncbi:MAG: ATP-binding protein, partial [Bacillota bacterium]